VAGRYLKLPGVRYAGEAWVPPADLLIDIPGPFYREIDLKGLC